MIAKWEPILTAPCHRDLQLSVIDGGEVHALAFPCRKENGGWVDALTGRGVLVDPTHWREWTAVS